LYLLRTGCPWRYLPRDRFQPRSTVYNIFRKFQRDGVWGAIWVELHIALREQIGREASPSAAVLDSPLIKSSEKGAGATTKWVTTPASGSRAARSTPWSQLLGQALSVEKRRLCGLGATCPPRQVRSGRAFAVVNYEQAVEPFLTTDRLSDTERAMLMGGACAKAYGWSPKKA
jgi:transposase